MRIRCVGRPGAEGCVPARLVGPSGDFLPAAFDAVVEPEDRPLRLRIEATYDGVERVRPVSVTVERVDSEPVTPEDMAATRLGWVMNRVVLGALRPRPYPVFHPRERAGPLSSDEVRTLARLYWVEYVAWGDPRRAVMRAFGIPRSTASYWIRKARDSYDLPGQHSGRLPTELT